MAEIEHRSVRQRVLVAIAEYLSVRETAEILADPAALQGLAEARESEQAGDVEYGVEALRALLAERRSQRGPEPLVLPGPDYGEQGVVHGGSGGQFGVQGLERGRGAPLARCVAGGR